MDKDRFLEVAHIYYALAVAVFLIDNKLQAASEREIVKGYQIPEASGVPDLLPSASLLETAFDWLEDQNLAVVLHNDFGPRMIMRSASFVGAYETLCKDKSLPFRNYDLLPNRSTWLLETLETLDKERKRLGIEFVGDSIEQEEWEPLPLDRSELELGAVIQAVDNVVEETRVDNGYAATHPEEREYVIDRLASLARRLKEATSISVGFIRRNGLDQLATLAKRFAGGARELVITVAREALKDWLRRKGITYLDEL